MSRFESLGLAGWLVRQAAAVGFKEPTPVQANCIKPILEGVCVCVCVCVLLPLHFPDHNASTVCTLFAGRDCIGCAKTGSGKTAAFALPILHRLSEDPYGIFALVMTPTR